MSDTTTPHTATGRGWGYAGALLGGQVSALLVVPMLVPCSAGSQH
jgi:hypothetical protein